MCPAAGLQQRGQLPVSSMGQAEEAVFRLHPFRLTRLRSPTGHNKDSKLCPRRQDRPRGAYKSARSWCSSASARTPGRAPFAINRPAFASSPFLSISGSPPRLSPTAARSFPACR